MEGDNSIDAPADSIKWAKNLFLTKAIEPQTSVVHKIAAVLQMNIEPNKFVFGERSAAASQERQMLFTTGKIDIDLRIKESNGSLEIRGQILAEGFEGAQIGISNKDMSFESSVNYLGEFRFEEIPNGIYDLLISNGETEIVVEDIGF
ncbi:MAG: hypothetical protein ACT4O9_13000 [Blastocatellia bacterium]